MDQLEGLAVTLHALAASNLGIFAIQNSQHVGNNMREDKDIESIHFPEI